MTSKSKRKGDTFERDLADFLSTHLGVPVMRSLYTGDPMVRKGKGNSDLIGTPELAIEAKRTETIRLHEAMAQAQRNASGIERPAVMYRRSHQKLEDSYVIMRLADWVELYRRWGETEGYFKPVVAAGPEDSFDWNSP